MPDTKAKLFIRQARATDARAIARLSAQIYGKADAFTQAEVRGQINNFPEGQFVAEYEKKIVGHCATILVTADQAFGDHTWEEISGGGYGRLPVDEADILYGFEVCVDPEFRRLRIGQRFYRKRRELCQNLELKGIAFGGRMPGFMRRKRTYKTPEAYLQAVTNKEVRDSVILFQMNQGFEPQGILHDYWPGDKESGGHAVLMYWANPLAPEEGSFRYHGRNTRLPSNVRLATVQFMMRGIETIDQFEEQVEYWVDVASDYNSDFVVFPELFTLELLSIEKRKLEPIQAIEKIATYTDRFCKFMEGLAVSYNINIIGGSHPTKVKNGDIHNISYIFLRDGSTHTQDKLHPTPSERRWWNIKGGAGASVIPTDCGPIGVMICYDSEFPELARHLVNQGALMLFVPFCTDERRGYLRVRYCCQARAVENQCYVVTSGVVGNLPNVEQMDIHYAESAILTPSDFPFARDGVAADTAPNTETIAIADLSLDDLLTSRQSGAVQNLKDRRFDLFRVEWREK
ncbi:hydrolase YhcX [Novosphingobium marinum]|uniref:Putative amidohydrolase/ribosomal protein S18 acetylase RimI-like enzyme n=1 Tax=Novosphingobium marinum TaxID=1514948 RepID=A0A7Y9XY69_9SPHN|nr:bifunctional GNAT family N-acetyltransferase/carbon-nitrogen hydrolase family protein [Novosphingobium marinum]NYH96777.1 putative amidohydrolase/ribosomal protein S18 acetylase RimI-like enzyme [Novosphingobium marinum]GGC40323.1 hydrolase YhcX [Novosphingobium marinum]